MFFKINLTMCFRGLPLSLQSKHEMYLNEITFVKYIAQWLAHNTCLSRVKTAGRWRSWDLNSGLWPLRSTYLFLEIIKKTVCWQQDWKHLLRDYLQITQAELPACPELQKSGSKWWPRGLGHTSENGFWLQARSQFKGMKESSRLVKMVPKYMHTLL